VIKRHADQDLTNGTDTALSRLLAARQGQLESLVADQREMAQALQAQYAALQSRRGSEGRSAAVWLSRRRMLQLTGAGLAGGAVLGAFGAPSLAGASTLSAVARPASSTVGKADGPVIYVPAPTGGAETDTPNILRCLSKAGSGSTVVFQTSATEVYSINQELPVRRGVRLTGMGAAAQRSPGGSVLPTMPTLQQAADTDLHCIVGSQNYLSGLYGPSNPGRYPQYDKLYNDGEVLRVVYSAIEVDHLAFDGQNGGAGSGNTMGHALVFMTYGANIHDNYILNAANTGLYMSDENYLGQGAINENHENRIQDNTIVNPGWWGIRVDNDPGGAGGSTDGHILNNIILSPSKQQSSSGPVLQSIKQPYEAIHMENAAGWWIVNNLMVACPGNGIYTNTTGGLHLDYNTIDGFGCYPKEHQTYVGMNITTAGQTKLHPGRVIGNVVVAYEAANPYSPATQAKLSNVYQYFKISMQIDVGRLAQPSYDAYPISADNVAHQGSQPPGPVPNANIPHTDIVTVPQGASAGVLVGMGISDALDLIKPGTMVTKVVPGTGANPDTIYLSSRAVRTATDDTVSFRGPTSVAWTYVNALASANMWVHRSNDVCTGSITAKPVITIVPTSGQPTPTVTLWDTEYYAGGAYIDYPSETASAGQIITASGTAGSATWAPDSSEVNRAAGGVLEGDLPDPTFSPDLVTTLTSSGTYTVPTLASLLHISGVGGGGGGGGGTVGTNRQVGGAGGAAGTTAEQIINVTGGSTLTVTIGAGGSAGPAGTSGRTGGAGGAGGTTTVSGQGVAVAAGGGPGGSGAAQGTEAVNGGAYGAPPGETSNSPTASSGGYSGQYGGSPYGLSPGGGGGGGGVYRTKGGGGGGAGTAQDGGGNGGSGASSNPSGQSGGSAGSPGCPGGGGGSAAAGGTAGAGGSGASGFVVIRVVG
jgi:hypothetical protein